MISNYYVVSLFINFNNNLVYIQYTATNVTRYHPSIQKKNEETKGIVQASLRIV